jgi:hypothetical protein
MVGLALWCGVPTTTDAAPVTFEEFVVEGEVLKPEITVFISRENLNKTYELELDENFLEKIIESVEHDPF